MLKQITVNRYFATPQKATITGLHTEEEIEAIRAAMIGKYLPKTISK